MRTAKDTTVSNLPADTVKGQDMECNASVDWQCVSDGIDGTLAVFGRQPEDDDFSLFLVDDAGMHGDRQLVLSRKTALEFAQTIMEIYQDAP